MARSSDLELLVAYGRRNWWVVVASVVAAILLGVAYLLLARPAYRATAVMLIQPQSSQPDTRAAAPATPELVRSQVEVLKSQPVLDAVVKQLRLDRDPEFAGDAPTGASAAVRAAATREELGDKLTADNDGRSYTVSMTAKSKDPAKAARIANTVAESYIEIQRAQKVRLVETTRSNLAKRLADLRAETFAAEQAAEGYRLRSGLVPLSSVPEDSESYAAATPASREIIEMSKEHAALAARRADAQAKYSAQQAAVARGRGDATSEVLSSTVVSELRQQESQLASREAELLARYRPDHPLVRPVQAELGQVRRAISSEVARIHRGVASAASASNQAYEGGDRFMTYLAQRRSNDLQASTRLTQLQREAKLKRDTYEEFAAQMQRASEQAGLQLPDVLLVSPATPPVRTSGPKPLIVLVVAAFLGLIAGLALGLLRSLAAERRVVRRETVRATA
ncbi:GumC family protein [Sphingomonas piscis]|uniref:GumC family protein n=1 Tax=Sphingomonas piscis TaxID=2714943 RepID=A0A6G7YRU4_9SPHN|nr:GumC family protein [Sphingomonas piscis]QIK79451.1 GumC family protein [Sphingomonas piscis]